MTELRLAGAVTIEEANALLKEFLDRFNARFGVPAQHPEAAYRPLGPRVCLDTALCFRHSRRVARDNTVKYRWRTLQLLPGTERRSYAGAVADVLEGLDGQLAVRYRGEIIPSQEAPPRPGILRSFNDSSSHGTPPPVGTESVPRHCALLQAQPQGGQGQHGEVPLENASVAARDGAAQLCGGGGRCAGRPGRPAGCALPGRDHPQPGGATPPRHTLQRLSRRWEAALAALDAQMDAGDADDTAIDNGAVRVRKAPAMQRRKPTPLQTARWNAVQKAKRRGLSTRGVARELGIHRDTAKKYMEALSPPMKRDRVE